MDCKENLNYFRLKFTKNAEVKIASNFCNIKFRAVLVSHFSFTLAPAFAYYTSLLLEGSQ